MNSDETVPEMDSEESQHEAAEPEPAAPAGTGKRRGRPALGALSGFVTGLGLALSLLFNGMIPLDSALLVVLPVAGLLLVWAVAMWAPIGRRST